MLRTTFFGLISMATLYFSDVAAVHLDTAMEVAFDKDLPTLAEVDAQADGIKGLAKKKAKQAEKKAEAKEEEEPEFTFINVHRDQLIDGKPWDWVAEQDAFYTAQNQLAKVGKNMKVRTLKVEMRKAPVGEIRIEVGASGRGTDGSIYEEMEKICEELSNEGG